MLSPKGGYLSGYSKSSKILITLMNHVLSFFLILLGSPILLTIALIVKLKDPGPVLYKGERLGINKKIFIMYKFRTLPVGAQKDIGAKVLSPTDYKLSFFSRFLRDTRLDELPQLFNILKGDMDFVGPRPLRPEIYEGMCKNIVEFDRRFSVRPGLVGYSQLFTPHSSPKTIRALIDNRSIYLKRSFVIDIFFIVVTMLIVLKKTVLMLAEAFWKYVVNIRILGKYEKEKRVLDRVKIIDASVDVYTLKGEKVCDGALKDMNEHYFRFQSDEAMIIGMPDNKENKGDQYFRFQTNEKLNLETSENKQFLFKLKRQIKRMKKRKVKTSKCLGEFYKSWEMKDGGKTRYVYIIKYKPVNQFYQYSIDQYFLDKSVMHYF